MALKSPLESLWPKIEMTGSCWIWTGTVNRSGHGMSCKKPKFGINSALVHRIFYETMVEHIPQGMEIDHLCRNPPCCNPSHMQVVTSKENFLRGNNPCAINSRKTHCPKGHELIPENLTQRKNGRRECKECLRLRSQKYRNKQ